MAPVILLAPNTGPGVGLGHLERILALADALLGRADPVVVTGSDGPEAERVAARGHVTWASDDAWPDRALAASNAVGAVVTVVDGYEMAPGAQTALRRRGRLVVVDDTNGPCDCDLLVNPAPGGDRLAPPDGVAQVLAGAAYALLASDYLEARAVRERGGVDKDSIAVVTGGANFGDLQSELVGALRGAAPGAILHVAVGPRASAPDAAEGLVVHRSPPTLAGLLAASALYVGSAGGSAVQAACVGVPAVVIPVVDNQVDQAAALALAGCAVAIPMGANRSAVVEPVRALLADPDRAEAMSAAGRRAVDGRGTERVARAIMELAATRSTS